MKKIATYSEALAKLEELLESLEDGNIQLEELASTVKQANELIEICEVKLRKINDKVEGLIDISTVKKK